MFLKDPGATLDYRIDWSGRIGAGESIATSSWSVEPAGEMGLSSPGIAGPVTFIWLNGGMPGRVYRLTNRVHLPDGGVDERTVVVRVEER